MGLAKAKHTFEVTELERHVIMDALAYAIEHDIFTDRMEDAASSDLYERLNLLTKENQT